MSPTRLKNLMIGATLVAGLSGFGASEALSQQRLEGKLGTAGVAVQVADPGSGGKLVVVKRNGRDFARYSAPAGTQGVLLCCFFGECKPVGPGNDFCDIVVNCPPGWGCFPE